MFPNRQVGGVALVSLVALLMLLLLCYGAGLLARVALGRALSATSKTGCRRSLSALHHHQGMTQAFGASMGCRAT